MGEKIVVGPISKGLRNDVTPFNVDNDSFPTLINAYQWRGRVKRKRGTSLLGRLQRYFDSLSASYNSGSTTIALDGSGNGNLLTGFTTLETNASIVPGTVTITAPGPTVYTDPSENGTLSPSGSINYATGAITIAAEAGNAVSATFVYYPSIPVMGLREFNRLTSAYPQSIAFDTKYSYVISSADPYPIYDVSFYKNPTTGTYTGYTQKTTVTPVRWNGQDYQQFYTINYQGAMWATNGINVPFAATNIGMPGITLTNVTIDAVGPPAIATITTSAAHGLAIGDFVFINEVSSAVVTGINFQTGYVTAVPLANQITVEFPNATLGGAGGATSGFVQYLTRQSSSTKDCIRWYDGDPTDGSATSPTLNGSRGWVNFCPPISQSSFPIGDLPSAQYYLVGCRTMAQFKDRLLFIGCVVQTSTGTPVYLQDTIIYSQAGTPYYTASFTENTTITSAATVFNPILVPSNQTATATSFFADSAGFGGFVQAGIDQPIISAESNEDLLILGYPRGQMRLVYTGNDIIPFNFFIINSELGTSSTFSAINMDRGIISRGDRGFIITSQTAVNRIDLDIPDEVFQCNLRNNGAERITAQRDFINEWIYFTYLGNFRNFNYPNQTLQYNYRDNSWAIFYESYTTYGIFRKISGFIWSTVGFTFPTWEEWNESWNAGSSTLFQPLVAAGNQQGFVLLRDDGTAEGNSLYIQSISGSTITSPSHGLNVGDYIVISGALGTIGSQINDKIFSVANVTNDEFDLNPTISSGTYLGGGVIKRMYIPFIQTRQFPVAWGMSRKTRIGPQQYLFTKTNNGQITLNIYLSQNDSSPYTVSTNDALMYSEVVYTCPESTNLGLTPFNVNINTPTAFQQSQIWHRCNNSLIGDTVQIGFTLSDAQMRDEDFPNQFSEIELHSFIIDVSPSQLLV